MDRQKITIENESLYIVFRDGTWWSCHEDHLKEAVKLHCEKYRENSLLITPGSHGNISSSGVIDSK